MIFKVMSEPWPPLPEERRVNFIGTMDIVLYHFIFCKEFEHTGWTPEAFR